MLQRFWHSPYLLLVFATLFWGGNAVGARFFAGSVPPFTLSLIRLTLSTLIILPFIYPLLRKEWGMAKKHYRLIGLLTVTGVVGFNLITYWAAHYTVAVNIGLINSTTPFFMVILSYLLMKEKMNPKLVAPIAISFLGILWIMAQGSFENLLGLQFNPGDLIMIVAVLFWAVYSIYVKKTGGALSSLSLFGYCSILGTLMLIPASYIELLSTSIKPIGPQEVIGLLYLGIFPSIGSFLFWNRAVLLVGPSRSSIFQNLIPVWGAMLAFLLLGEGLTSAHWIGGMLVFMGVFLSRLKSTKQEPSGSLAEPLRQGN